MCAWVASAATAREHVQLKRCQRSTSREHKPHPLAVVVPHRLPKVPGYVESNAENSVYGLVNNWVAGESNTKRH